MMVKTKNGKPVKLERFNIAVIDQLVYYLDNLSDNTRSRFGPHPFDKRSVADFYTDHYNMAYLASEDGTQNVVGYAIVKQGFLHYEAQRLQGHGLELNSETDCTFAPSVADMWQSAGVGNLLFHFMLDDFKERPFKQIILWGGVQSSNEKAIGFYKRNGFRELGYFEHNGIGNFDMIKDI